MNWLRELIHFITNILVEKRYDRYRRLVMTLSVVTVFLTTYMLILPAITLVLDKAEEMGGIDVPAIEAEYADSDESSADDTEDADEGAEETVEENTEKSDEGRSEDNDQADSESDDQTSKESDNDTSNEENLNPSVADNGLLYEGKNYSIAVTDKNNSLPADTRVDVKEISEEDKDQVKEYKSLYKDALKAVREDGAEIHDFKFARFYNISLLSGDEEVELKDAVDVTISYEKALQKQLKITDADKVRIIHFAEDKTTGEVIPEILDSKKVDSMVDRSKLKETTFEAEGFSVYAVVGTTIEKTVLASDGHNYRITATYGADTGIPEDADLAVEEIIEESAAYDEYVEKTEKTLGVKAGSTRYIRLFDIKIVDKGDSSAKYQPKKGSSVDVCIELADSDSEELKMVHFADGNSEGNVVDAVVNKQTIKFEADGFSVYAIADTAETDPSGTVSRKYEFYTDNTFGTPYEFVNKEGELTSVQYVTENGTLYNPDAPTGGNNDKQFVGWADESGTIILQPGEEGIVISGVSGTDGIVKLYPRFEEVYYIEYYDEHHVIHKTESTVNGDFTVDNMKADLLEDGEYRITYQPDDSDEAFMGWSLEDHSLNTVTEVDFTGDSDKKIELYPGKAKVYWINFDKNDAGGTSKATYTAPLWVLQTDNKVSDRHSSLPEPTRPGYEFGGWYTDPECNDAFDLDTHLTGDITLYANWIPSDQTYTVVILKQRITDSVTATAEEKTYDYETSYTLHGTTGSTASVPNQYKNLDFDGFDYAHCDDNTTIAADGSTVLYVYYDRKIVTFNFYLYGQTGSTVNYTTINENQANTNYNNRIDVYGDYQGEKVKLTRTSNTTTSYYLSEDNYYGAPEYTGTVYESRNGRYREAEEPYSTNRTYYYRYWQSYFPFGGEYRYSRLNWRSETTTTHTWYTPDGAVYHGPFYNQTTTQAGTRWYLWKSMTGLYGSSLNGEWPSEYWWYSSYNGSTGAGTRTTFLDAFLPSGTSMDVNFYGNTGSGTSSIRFYQQNVDGETYSLPSGGTVTSTSNASFNLTDKYTGFHIAEYRTRRNGRWSDWITPGEVMYQSGSYYYDADPYTYGYQYINSGFTDLEIRYDRNTYNIDFLDGFNHTYNELADSASVLYGRSLENVDPGTPDVTHEGYTFTGWYTDPDCKNRFDFASETMPANNLVLYAGWEKQRFRIWVQPNGGILSPTESTYFRTDYGELIQEYSDVEHTGRNYYASDDGEYSYIYICDPANHDQARVAYYKKTSELGVITLQKEDENGNIINDVYDEREWTDGKKYSYQKGVYEFVGWYRVEGDISEETPPEILESDELTLWNFNTPVTEPIAIRAIWKRVGSFRVAYDKNMYDEAGNEIVVPGAEGAVVPPTTLYTYGDLSQAIVGHEPTAVPGNYTFVGWRTPAGEIVQPNDTVTIHSALATLEGGIGTADPKYVYKLTAVYKQIDVTTLTYDANGGEGTLTDLDGTASESENAVYGTNQIAKLELNSKLELSNGTGFTRELYRLIGWNDDKTAANNGIVKYELGGTYGIDDTAGNTLYAVWELKTIPVPFEKLGENEAGEYELLGGAEFRLYTEENCQNLISSVYDDLEESDAIVTSADTGEQNVVFPKVPIGTYYFKETSVYNKYKLDETVHKIVVTESDDAEHKLSYTIDDSTEPLVIKNHLKGTLVVSKTVDSVIESDSHKDFSFTASLSDTNINGTYGDLTFNNGVAEFTLKHGEEKKIRNLVGKQITVTENNAEKYATTATAKEGIYNSKARAYTITIPEDGDAISFNNELKGIPVRILKETQFGDPLGGAGFSISGEGIEDAEGLISSIPEGGTEAVVTEFEALPLGTYTLTETSAPDGYTSLEGPVEITVGVNDSGDVTLAATIGGKTDDSHVRIERDVNAEGKPYKLIVVNDAGAELPHTGGIGTTLYYIIGTLLVACSALALITRRRHGSQAGQN